MFDIVLLPWKIFILFVHFNTYVDKNNLNAVLEVHVYIAYFYANSRNSHSYFSKCLLCYISH